MSAACTSFHGFNIVPSECIWLPNGCMSLSTEPDMYILLLTLSPMCISPDVLPLRYIDPSTVRSPLMYVSPSIVAVSDFKSVDVMLFI